MKPYFIYLISTLYMLQSVQYWYAGQFWPGMLTIAYAAAGIPLIFMTQQ